MKSLVLSLKVFLRLFTFRLTQRKSETALCKQFNFLNGKLFRSPVVLQWDEETKSYLAVEKLDSKNKIYIYNSRKERLALYFSGIRHRVNALATKYLISLIDIVDNDVVIDCGANVGEIGKYFQLQGINIDYHAFEPSLPEFESCKLNNQEGTINHKGLWKESTQLEFFEKNDTADSSFIEMSGYKDKANIEVTCLEDYLLERKIEKVKLLKLEAEGAEPEILLGAKNILDRIDWITADCGPERGINKEMTFKPVINFLFENGFKLEAMNPKKSIVLLKNSKNH